jgi:hypothetical protein
MCDRKNRVRPWWLHEHRTSVRACKCARMGTCARRIAVEHAGAHIVLGKHNSVLVFLPAVHGRARMCSRKGPGVRAAIRKAAGKVS